MARGKHLFPFRTEKLSPSAPMVLGLQGPGRVGRRRFIHLDVRLDRTSPRMQDVWKFLRSNPQVLVLLIICLVLGLGAFLAVMFGLLSAKSGTTTGEPSGVITLASLFLG